jgi:hypothetical protein
MKWHGSLAAGVVLGLAVTACGSVTQQTSAVSAQRTVRSSAASKAPKSAPASATAAASSSSAPSRSLSPTMPPATLSSSVWFDCSHRGLVKPSDYILTCADAGSVLDHLTWESWTAQQAVATGLHGLNDCTPNCAEGKFIDYPAVITLSRSEPVSGHPGERSFTRITVRYTGSRPPAYMSNGQLVRHPAQWTQPLGPFGP